jgi:hypothetical protein
MKRIALIDEAIGRHVKSRYSALIAGKDRKAFEKMGLLVEKLSSPITPSYKIRRGEAIEAVFKMGGVGSQMNEWLLLAEEIDQILHSLGYRDGYDIRTLQEHKLVGSTCAGTVDDGSARVRYTPVGVLSGKLTLEEADNARRLSAIIDNFPYFVFYSAGADKVGPISLECLDGKGMTNADPRPLDMMVFETAFKGGNGMADVFELARMEMGKQDIFPFRRD